MTPLTAVQSTPPTNPRMTNLGKLLITEICNEHLRYVRVINKTANVTNGSILVRRFVDLPDGMYDIVENGMLVETKYPYGMRYPDVGPVEPDFKKMKPNCQVDRNQMGSLINIANEIFKKRGWVILDHEKIFSEQDPKLGMSFPFNLPSPINWIRFNQGNISRHLLKRVL